MLGQINKYFVETLHHFTCPSCKGWWSIAMEENSRNNWFCPHCGEEHDYSIAINHELLHDTEVERYSQMKKLLWTKRKQVDWIEEEVRCWILDPERPWQI